MRPDEHKRKKNVAYKKKHGISNKSSSADNNASSAAAAENDKKLKKEHKVKNVNSEISQTSKYATKTSKTSDFSDSSGSDQEVVEKKSFRRREIVSNWRKYELEPESDGAVKSRGEDFEKLLNMAGEAMSRFRFKDELEWEEVEGRLGEGDNTEQDIPGSGVLSLDLADIGSSMSCIPIHHLLGIDQSLFPTDQLESHIQSVTEKRNFYNDIIRQKQEQSKLMTSEISKDFLNSSNDSNHISVTAHDQVRHKHSQVDEKPKTLGTNVKVNEPLKTDKDIERPPHELKENTVDCVETVKSKPSRKSEPSISLQDDDLDQLLDMDIRQEEVIGAGKQGVTESSMERGSDSDIAKGLSAPKKGFTPTDAEKEADELEDWLDSILD